MITFPLDITEYEANALGAWFGTRTRGVFASEDDFNVTANGNMSITLSPGYGWLKPDRFWGVVILETNATVMQFATADGSLTRWAAICLRLDKNLNISFPTIKYGPFGTNPGMDTLPPPARDLDYDEIYVAAVRIRAGATEILPSDIVDLRLDETYCGIMRDGVTGIPTQILHDTWYSWFSELVYTAESQVDSLNNDGIAALEEFRDKLKDFEETAMQETQDLLEQIKDLLDEEAVGYLLNLINGLQASKQDIPIEGNADPTFETVGKVGQMYRNLTTGKMFICVDITGGVFRWQSLTTAFYSGGAWLGAGFLGASYLIGG